MHLLLYSTGKLEEAVADLEKFAEIYPDHDAVWGKLKILKYKLDSIENETAEEPETAEEHETAKENETAEKNETDEENNTAKENENSEEQSDEELQHDESPTMRSFKVYKS